MQKFELLPCPFCGSMPELPIDDGISCEVECGDCFQAKVERRHSVQSSEDAQRKAIKAWNTRAPTKNWRNNSEHKKPAEAQQENDSTHKWVVPVFQTNATP